MTAKKKLSDEGNFDVMNEVNRVPMTKESRERMSLNIYDLQYLIRLQDLSNEAFKQTFDEEFKDSVVKSVSAEVAEVVAPIYKKLEELAKGQEEIKVELGMLKKEVETDKQKLQQLNETADCNKKDIAKLRKDVDAIKPDLIKGLRDELLDLVPLLRKSARLNSWWAISLRILIALLLGWAGIIWFLIRKGILSL